MNKYSAIILSSFLLSLTNSLNSTSLDEEAFEFEKNKRLTLFDMQPYYAQERSIYESEQPNEEDYEGMDLTYLKVCPFPEEDFNIKFDGQELLKLQQREDEEKRQIQSIESKIQNDLQQYFVNPPQFLSSTINDITSKNDITWARKAYKIAKKFKEGGHSEQASYFFDLASSADFIYEKLHTQSWKGGMHLAQYNDEIRINQPSFPTASLFYNLNSTLQSYIKADIEDIDAIRWAIPALERHRDMIVRWHVSAQNVIHDDNLKKSIYAKGLINLLIDELWPKFKVLLPSLSYDGTGRISDLAHHLKNLGFYCYKQSDSQDNWINIKGWQIRVKHQKPEFTIGFTFENPVEWDNQGIPTGLKAYSNGQRLITDSDNEILKLVIEDRSIYLIPAFNNYSNSYWNLLNGTLWHTDHSRLHNRHNLRIMDNAHKPLSKISNKRSREFRNISREELNRLPIKRQR